ncbi:hypothetical protein NE236_08610 [Actinoallomurus purpureus]|uniref:hypothetical protein n=1 Tax=Actinoallomurus purpureus TaxID=478114 RepID=UPI002093564B|nr:hypothetical protein [Actinoallomurus purpureus]MCO6005042.1 hypothetical protein [Actinoallomurus purpureus]
MVIEELVAAVLRGVSIDMILETTVREGGALAGNIGGVAVFRRLEDLARFWRWPSRNRPVVGRSRAASTPSSSRQMSLWRYWAAPT